MLSYVMLLSTRLTRWRSLYLLLITLLYLSKIILCFDVRLFLWPLWCIINLEHNTIEISVLAWCWSNLNLDQLLSLKGGKFGYSYSGQSYDWSSVLTDQISNLTKQSFPEIRRNDWSLNETIWTLTCNKWHVFEMVEEIKRKRFLDWILSLHATKFYETKVYSFCIGKLLR